jgi:hypothetical protein
MNLVRPVLTAAKVVAASAAATVVLRASEKAKAHADTAIDEIVERWKERKRGQSS